MSVVPLVDAVFFMFFNIIEHNYFLNSKRSSHNILLFQKGELRPKIVSIMLCVWSEVQQKNVLSGTSAEGQRCHTALIKLFRFCARKMVILRMTIITTQPLIIWLMPLKHICTYSILLCKSLFCTLNGLHHLLGLPESDKFKQKHDLKMTLQSHES